MNNAEQLGLDEEADLPEIISAYRSQTVVKARDQLEQMVQDLAAPSDNVETLDRMLDLARNVDVHAISAVAYCRLKGIGHLRKDYGIASVEATGIPEIHQLLQRISNQVGADFTAGRRPNAWTSSGRRSRFFLRKRKVNVTGN